MITVTTRLHIHRENAGRKRLASRPRSSDGVPKGRIPRVSRLMALAIRFQGLLEEGTVKCLSELARLAGVTQPRMTQIMNLTFLAPDIQEALLFLLPVEHGRDPLELLEVQRIASEPSWERQREKWTPFFAGAGACL